MPVANCRTNWFRSTNRIRTEDKMGENVRSVERMFDLLEIISVERSPISLTELAEKAGLSKTTTHRLMQTLCSRGYAEKTEKSRYFLGPKVIELASYHIGHLELHMVAMPLLAELYSRYKLTVYLGKLVHNKIIYTELMSDRITLDNIQDGMGLPAYPSAIGKCCLAALSGDELDERLYRYPLVRYTDKTITDPAVYKKHLRTVRENGWALNDGESLAGMRFLAAPVYNFSGATIAGISISGNLDELSDERLPAVTEAVKETAAAISRRMGYLP